jgi:hypothetical protein
MNAEIILGTVEGLVEATEIEPNRWGAVIGKEVKSMVREGRAKLYKAVSKDLIEEPQI